MSVAPADFTSAIERIVAGLEKKSRIINPREREIVAHHETGHTLVALALPGTDPIHKVSIIPRGVGAFGYTIQRPIEDLFLMSESALRTKMAVLLGGRAAESIVFGEVSTGEAAMAHPRNRATLETGARRLREKETLLPGKIPPLETLETPAPSGVRPDPATGGQ